MIKSLHEFLDKKYTLFELLYVFWLLLLFSFIAGKFFGNKVQIILGILMIITGIYGFIRYYFKENKK